ncbi:hypothetical protein ACFLRC_00115 [Candidatus Altiarchaeota archaeon]
MAHEIPISFRLPRDLVSDLEMASRISGKSKTSFVREGLHEAISKTLIKELY